MSTLSFVIDGTNVALLHGRVQPELRYVLALCNHLRKSGDSFVCFFDANTDYILKEHGAGQFEVFQQIMRDKRWSESLHVVPSGTEADELILSRAKAEGADVVSNDKYRDRARDHRWIWKRRHPLVGLSDRMIVETLGVEIPVRPSATDYL